MHNQYKCGSKSLFINGLIFLLAFPLVCGGLVWGLHIWQKVVIFSLSGIYCIDLIIVGWLFLSAWHKSIIVEDKGIGFKNKLTYRFYPPEEIEDIMLLANQKGREFVRVKTKTKKYFVDDQYQPFETLLTDMENACHKWDIAGNLRD